MVKYYNDRNFSSSTDPEMLTIADIIKSLNNEVEIIEENKEIGKLKVQYGLNEYKINDYYGEKVDYEIAVKINELIDKINSMEDK